MTRINDALSSFTQSLITQSSYGYRDKPLYIGGTYGVLKVYPAIGNQFSLQALNVAYDLPAFTTATFFATTSIVWVVV